MKHIFGLILILTLILIVSIAIGFYAGLQI